MTKLLTLLLLVSGCAAKKGSGINSIGMQQNQEGTFGDGPIVDANGDFVQSEDPTGTSGENSPVVQLTLNDRIVAQGVHMGSNRILTVLHAFTAAGYSAPAEACNNNRIVVRWGGNSTGESNCVSATPLGGDLVLLAMQSAPHAWATYKAGAAKPTQGDTIKCLTLNVDPSTGNLVYRKSEYFVRNVSTMALSLAGDETFDHKCQTSSTDSGAPVFKKFDNGFQLIGIHIQGGNPNKAQKLSSGTCPQAEVQ